MDNRIITNIKEALARSVIPETSYDVNNSRLIEKDMSIDAKVSLFETRAEFSGSKVHIADSVESLKTIFSNIISSESSVMSALQGDSIALIGDLRKILTDDCNYFAEESLDADQLFNVDIAITDVTLAVAETGSILIGSNASGSRMKSLVCAKHIALIRADQIFSDLMDVSQYLSSLNPEELPGGFNLISGPSKTADIELQLVIGVHGPAELHLVILKDWLWASYCFD